MIDVFLSLIIASIVGTFMWSVQTGIKPITQKVFSQTWHYYTSLIPVFFLFGGSVIVRKLAQWVRSVSSSTGASPSLGTMTEKYVPIPLMEQTTNGMSLMNFHISKAMMLLATLVWAVGTVVFLAVNVKKYWAFKRSILYQSRVCDTLRCPVKVIISANATTPMLMGLWKPILILPDTQLDDKELGMILSHELVHFQRGDLVVKLMALIANAIHWFNPAAYALNKQIQTFCELSCDEKVVREMDAENRKFYGKTLLTMLEYGMMKRNVVLTSSLCNSKKNMKRRLINLMNVKKTKKSVIMLSLAATISMAGIGGLVAYAAESAKPSESAPARAIPPNKIEGRNIYVQSPDGTAVYYDKDGNVSPVKQIQLQQQYDAETQKKIDELNEIIDSYIQRGLPAPQQYLDAVNEAKGIKPFADK